MISGIDVPLEVAGAMSLLFMAAGAAAGYWRAMRKAAPLRNPLTELLQPANLGPAIDLASHRNAVRGAARAVLHGRIDQLSALHGRADPDLREQVRAQVAGVMRAGLRCGDSVTHLDSEGFTIDIPGADEGSAARIADRLRQALTKVAFGNSAALGGLTARFGVAAGDSGDNGDLLIRRARRALEEAVAKGDANVVAASDIEEVIYLPAPAPSPSQTASAA